MNTTGPKPPRSRNAVLDTLNASFKVFRDCRPLALGIHKAIKERLPDTNARELRNALRMHTASTRYLKALSQAGERFDLDDVPAGEVTAEQQQQATSDLRLRFKKQAELHKAEQAAKQHRENLLKLADKFNTR